MIRRVRLPGIDQETSSIGFGCASLGSRISKSQGLKSLGLAFDEGVTWYDVAPPYGAGEAEEILGAFVKGRRDKLMICTKVGLAPPPRNGAMKAAYSLGRPLLKFAGGLRSKFRKIPATRNQKLPLNAAMIKASIDNSLLRLQTDYIDVFALHKPSLADLQTDEVRKALEEAVSSGKARFLGVAGDYEAAEVAVLGTFFNVAQLADDPESEPLKQLAEKSSRPMTFVTHSVLGVAGAKDRLIEKISRDQGALLLLHEAGYAGPVEKMAADLLLDRALASNAHGPVLVSMFSSGHMKTNVARASSPVQPGSIGLVNQVLAG